MNALPQIIYEHDDDALSQVLLDINEIKQMLRQVLSDIRQINARLDQIAK